LRAAAWKTRLDVEVAAKDMQAARIINDRAARALKARASEFQAACALSEGLF
jgi:hypothetical protein